jgi:hypothetical protein
LTRFSLKLESKANFKKKGAYDMPKQEKNVKFKPVFRSPNGADMSKPLVKHYTEVLLLPFRVADGAFSIKSTSLKQVSELMGKTDDLKEKWERIPAGNIPAVDCAGNAMKEPWDKLQHFQALAYFHHTVRSFLFGSETAINTSANNYSATTKPDAPANANASANDYLYWYRNKELKALSVEFMYERERYTVEFTVVRCDLALMQPDVGILQLELRANICDCKPHPLGLLQRARDYLRRLYPPYFEFYEGWKGGHFPIKVVLKGDAGRSLSINEFDNNTPTNYIDSTMNSALLPRNIEQMPMANHWAYLLAPFGMPDKDAACGSASNSPMLITPSDDRLPSMAFIAVDEPQKISEGDWARLAFADDYGTDVLPCSRTSLHDFKARFCYDRFWYDPVDSGDEPSRILNCGYAFTHVGSSKSGFFMSPENGAYVAFRQLYVRMGLIAHFQKTALLGASARLSALSERDTATGTLKAYENRYDEIKEFYKHFIEFTHVFWFDEVSPQEQGQVLFDMWQRELRTKELYAEVRQELKDLMDYVNAEQAHRQTATTEQFTRTATVLGGVGVVAGLLGMNILPFGNGLYEIAKDKDYWSLPTVITIGSAILFAGALAIISQKRIPNRLANWLGKKLAPTKPDKSP